MDVLDTQARARQPHRGREAQAPHEMPGKGWKDILLRTFAQISKDRVMLIAAGATYYTLLAIFPAVTATVSIYGLFADPASISQHVAMLSSVVPEGGLQIIQEQLNRLAQQDTGTLGLALVVSILVALWSAGAGVRALFEAMNVAYEEKEERGFLTVAGVTLLFTLATVVAAIVMIGVVVLIPAVLGLFGLSGGLEWLIRIGSYVLLAAVVFAGLCVLYRYGPSRHRAQWRWIVPGALFSLAGVLVISILYSWYTANFANYDATYGSLGALIGFLIWVWVSLTVVIVGAELSSEIEHQTARDSTVGPEAPIGERHAAMADTIGRASSEKEDHSVDWRAGYRAGQQEYLRPERQGSLVANLAYAVPAAVLLFMLERRRKPTR